MPKRPPVVDVRRGVVVPDVGNGLLFDRRPIIIMEGQILPCRPRQLYPKPTRDGSRSRVKFRRHEHVAGAMDLGPYWWPGRVCCGCKKWKSRAQFPYTDREPNLLKNSYCRACHRTNRQLSYERNIETVKKQVRRWREANPERVRELKRRWKKAHPESSRAYVRRRKALLRGGTGGHSEAEWVALCAQYGGRCLRCSRTDTKLTRDHIVPVSKGGTDNIDNIQPLCAGCNNKKRTRTIDYRPVAQ